MRTSYLVFPLTLIFSAAALGQQDQGAALLGRLLDGMRVRGVVAGTPAETPNGGAEAVFHAPNGIVFPVGLRVYKPGELDQKWLSAPGIQTVLESLDLGDRSGLYRFPRQGGIVFGFVQVGERTLTAGSGHPEHAVTKAEEQEVVRLLRAMYAKLQPAQRSFKGKRHKTRADDEVDVDTNPPGDGLLGVAESRFGNFQPEDTTLARLRRLHGVLQSFYEKNKRMPADVDELMASGLVRDRTSLLDARQPILIKDPFDRRALRGGATTFRFTQAWRDGAIATTDLPREGQWVILTGSGEVFTQPVDSAWLGKYEPKQLSDTERNKRIDKPVANFGVYGSSGETNSGRFGVGVDELIPGYMRHGISRNWSPLGGETDLRPGDLIVTCNGVRVESLADLEHVIGDGQFGINEIPVLEVIRDGRIVSVEPLIAYDPIVAQTPRERRREALSLLRRNDPNEARDVDLVLLGMLDLAALRARPGAFGRLGPELYIRGVNNAAGPEAALDEIDQRLAGGNVGESRRHQLIILRSEQLRSLGRLDEALRALSTLESRIESSIQDSLQGSRQNNHAQSAPEQLAYELHRLREVWIDQLGTLVQLGRVDDAIKKMDVILARTSLPFDKAKELSTEVSSDFTEILMNLGYPGAALAIVQRIKPLFAGEEGFDEFVPIFESHVQSIIREIDN